MTRLCDLFFAKERGYKGSCCTRESNTQTIWSEEMHCSNTRYLILFMPNPGVPKPILHGECEPILRQSANLIDYSPT